MESLERRRLWKGEDAARAIPNMGLESKVMREYCFIVERDAWLRGEMGNGGCERTCGDVGVSLIEWFCSFGVGGNITLSSLDVVTKGDVIDEDDCDDDG
ncbi:hypothetical protein Tco_0984922 [Tanacetum coccineum]